MRVITGLARGKKLVSPRGNRVRPTADKIKESLFNIINPIIEDSVFIDCFAGTGSIGIEALSRGAREVYFIENNRTSLRTVKENLEITRLQTNAKILACSVEKGLKELHKNRVVVDVFFMDPPYGFKSISSIITKIYELNLLSDNGVIIVEHDSSYNPDDEIFDFHISDSRNYGTTVMTYYKRR